MSPVSAAFVRDFEILALYKSSLPPVEGEKCSLVVMLWRYAPVYLLGYGPGLRDAGPGPSPFFITEPLSSAGDAHSFLRESISFL